MSLRVAVVTGRIGDLDPVEAGAAIGRGAARHAQVAVVPVADGGSDLATALAALWAAEPEGFPDRWLVRSSGRVLVGLRQPPLPAWAPEASTRDLGKWVATSLRDDDQEVVIDLTGVTAHDGGAGLLRDVAPVLGGRRLTGLVPAPELGLPATGIGSGLAQRAFEARIDVAELLAADARLVEWARGLGAGLETVPGGGAAGGCGLAVLALGGHLETATEYCYREANLAPTMHTADLVITGCARLSALDRGGPVVLAVVEWTGRAQRPCVLITSGPGLARRELRTIGIEAAHLVPDGMVSAPALAEVAGRVTAGWLSGS